MTGLLLVGMTALATLALLWALGLLAIAAWLVRGRLTRRRK